MNAVSSLLIISASQGVIFGLVILISPFFRSKTNNYLSYAILIVSLLMLNVYLDDIAVFIKYPKVKVLYDIEWIFLFPVFFFIYFLKSINHDLEKSKKLYWLYTPFMLSVIINVVFNLEYAYKWYAYTWEHKGFVYKMIFDIQELGYYSFNFILVIWSYKILKEKKYSTHPNTKWLKKLCVWIFLLIISWILIDIADMIFNIGYEIGISIICTGTSVFVFWVVYYGVYTLKLTNDKNDILLVNPTEILDKRQQKELTNPDTSFSEDNIYFQKLKNLLQKDCIYRDPNLSQEMIAKLLNISSGYLSQIVNDITKKNFTIYINSYRVKEVKCMILNTEFDKYSLLAIGLEAGFKSKTTFYTSFKKETGLTPSQFRSKNKKVPNF
ncbi:AraC-like DNA-binding protein [Aquimarina sp. MAR_2010_214]|uniref:helix-turn-helix domain-containing protein n=1 Tax=Aquimarina sp. MAR_2010_214 TaxID=1250026 RepID=UPI000C6FFFA2|nr:helix-turn-helix domain-containing protein [Aquimarina sp. MAR_2010_214]PKV48452.1 AraC-like DNA-binding protein [Aquimarina sp. MAR_2010_214]